MKPSDLLPIRIALKFGPWMVVEATFLDRDEPEEVEISNTGVRLGFALEPVDELAPRLEPLEDRNAADEASASPGSRSQRRRDRSGVL
jgi:hypothetical protein